MRTIAISLLLVSSIASAEDLSPDQEEVKTAFDEEIAEPLATMNGHCGTKVAITVDWTNYKTSAWEGGIQPLALCRLVVNEIGYTCRDRAPYKKAISKQLKGISCTFADVKPKQKKDGANEPTRRNMTFAKGTFTYRMHGEHVNVEDATVFTLEKTIGKK